MKPIKNKYLLGLIYLVLISAVLHMGILIVYSLVSGNFQVLNFFSIISLNLIMPSIGEGWSNFFISAVVAIAIYIISLWVIDNSKKK